MRSDESTRVVAQRIGKALHDNGKNMRVNVVQPANRDGWMVWAIEEFGGVGLRHVTGEDRRQLVPTATIGVSY